MLHIKFFFFACKFCFHRRNIFQKCNCLIVKCFIKGKLCIHPGQVAVANQGFLPSEEEVDRALRLLAAYEIGIASGVSAIDFEGQMVDEPLASQARQVLVAAGIEAENRP